jgi:CBS domain-containing protein
MKIGEIMSRDVELVAPEATVQDAAQAMSDLDSRYVAIGSGGAAAGMLTDRDILIRLVARGLDPQRTRVEEVMSAELVLCREDDDAAHVLESMEERQIRRMPVVDEAGRLLGIVTEEAIGRALGGADAAVPAAAVESQSLRHAAGDKPRRGGGGASF